MIERFKQEKTSYKILTMAVLAAAVVFICRIVYAGILALPYPKELLEASNVALTNEFIAGQSPYTVASLSRRIPGINYDYPFVNSLVAALIAMTTKCTAVMAHFFVSLISILASGLIGFILVSRCSKTTVAPALAFILFMFCHWRFGYISAAPDDLGLLMLLLTSLAAVSPRIKNKPVWCSLGITICFYTKQYFVFVAVGIFIYMLMYSRKEAIKLFVWSLVINVAVCVIITIFWPLYWTKAFLFTYLGTAVGGGGAIATFLYQVKYLVILFVALFIVIVVSAAMALRKLYKSNQKLSNIKIKENDPFAMSAVQSVVMLIPLYVIGRNDGALMSYFLQLWIPFVIVTALVCFERMLPVTVETEQPEKQSDQTRFPYKEYIFACIYAGIAALTIYFGFGKLPLHILTEQEIANWQKAYEYTAQYSNDGDIFYSRGMAYDGFLRGNGEWMCGHEGEVDEKTECELIKEGVPIENFPYIPLIVNQNLAYRTGMLEKARNHEYSLITFEVGDHFTVFNEGVCERYGYTCIDILELQFGNMPYRVAFYAVQ